MILSFALLLANPTSVSLRPDAPPVTQTEAGKMSPDALADALLAPGHPTIVERDLPPIVAPPPPSYVAPLDVRLFVSAVLDPASGFCVKRSWRVTGTSAGVASAVTPASTLYRLPPAVGGCDGPHFAFFSVPEDKGSRALEVVRIIAAAVHRAAGTLFPVSIDDQEGRDAAEFCRDDKNFCTSSYGIIIDGREGLALFPIDEINETGRTNIFQADLLSKAELTAPDGHRHEDSELAAKDYTVNVALDGDRIVIMKLRRAVPPPF